MARDFANDPRFVRLPQQFIDELKKHPFTAGEGTDNAYHEVQFDIGFCMAQCADNMAGSGFPAMLSAMCQN